MALLDTNLKISLTYWFFPRALWSLSQPKSGSFREFHTRNIAYMDKPKKINSFQVKTVYMSWKQCYEVLERTEKLVGIAGRNSPPALL